LRLKINAARTNNPSSGTPPRSEWVSAMLTSQTVSQ
jgi:hypothetical protein